MNTKSFIITLLFPILTFSQIGIGTSVVDPSAKLQIDSSNSGFLQPRVALTSTADAITIATPATGLMVFNTATAGSGDATVTPGVYYHNGTAWQRLADQQEATASSTTFVNGNLSGSGYTGTSGEFISYLTVEAKSFGASITLPPGKWEVVLELTADITFQFDVQPALPWMNYWLDENTPPSDFSYFQRISGTIGTADALFTGGASFVRPVGGITVSNHKGSFFINNTSSIDKTYNLYYLETIPYNHCEFDNCVIFNYYNFGGAGWPGNRFYATKIN